MLRLHQLRHQGADRTDSLATLAVGLRRRVPESALHLWQALSSLSDYISTFNFQIGQIKFRVAVTVADISVASPSNIIYPSTRPKIQFTHPITVDARLPYVLSFST